MTLSSTIASNHIIVDNILVVCLFETNVIGLNVCCYTHKASSKVATNSFPVAICVITSLELFEMGRMYEVGFTMIFCEIRKSNYSSICVFIIWYRTSNLSVITCNRNCFRILNFTVQSTPKWLSLKNTSLSIFPTLSKVR